MGSLCVGYTELLLHHAVDILGVLSDHHVGEFLVSDCEAEVLDFLIKELLSNHGIEHLLLEHGVVHALVLGLSLLRGVLHAALEFLNVDFVTVDFCNGSAGAEKGATGSKEVTDDKSQQTGSHDDEQEGRLATDFF